MREDTYMTPKNSDSQTRLKNSDSQTRLKSGQNRTQLEREEALSKLAALERRGYTIREMAASLECSISQVQYDLKKLRERYREEALTDTVADRERLLQQLREVRKEAWEAWERSKQDHVKIVQEQAVVGTVGRAAPRRVVRDSDDAEVTRTRNRGSGGDRDDNGDDNFEEVPEAMLRTVKVQTLTEGRLPNNEYLQTVLRTLDREAEIKGIGPENETGRPAADLDWDEISRRRDRDPDPIEQKIAAMEALGKIRSGADPSSPELLGNPSGGEDSSTRQGSAGRLAPVYERSEEIPPEEPEDTLGAL